MHTWSVYNFAQHWLNDYPSATNFFPPFHTYWVFLLAGFGFEKHNAVNGDVLERKSTRRRLMRMAIASSNAGRRNVGSQVPMSWAWSLQSGFQLNLWCARPVWFASVFLKKFVPDFCWFFFYIMGNWGCLNKSLNVPFFVCFRFVLKGKPVEYKDAPKVTHLPLYLSILLSSPRAIVIFFFFRGLSFGFNLLGNDFRNYWQTGNFLFADRLLSLGIIPQLSFKIRCGVVLEMKTGGGNFLTFRLLLLHTLTQFDGRIFHFQRAWRFWFAFFFCWREKWYSECVELFIVFFLGKIGEEFVLFWHSNRSFFDKDFFWWVSLCLIASERWTD